LADRTINVFLPSLADDKRKDEKVLYAEYEAALPRILGAVFDALSGAIRNLPHTKLGRLPRMADVAKFVTSAEENLGWERGKFMTVYEEYRRTSKINALEASHVGTALLTLMGTLSRWDGTAAELLEELHKLLPRTNSRNNFPTSARSMSGKLRRLIPNLKEVGIEVKLPEGARRIGGKVARKITLTNSSWNGALAGEEATEQPILF
jgi:hypothetical protein